MKSVRETCVPRPEVLRGDLEDAIFAADFGQVVGGVAPSVYQDPERFFANTYPTATLKKVVTTVFDRLANPNEAGFPLRLSTGFGGGKTHTLIALWHLAHNIARPTLGTQLLPAAGRPRRVAVAGLDARAFGKSLVAEHGAIKVHSLWGEVAYQLGGEPAYRAIEAMDSPDDVPPASKVREMLPDGPVLILLDELVMYMAILNEQEKNAVLSFVSTLMAEVGARRQAVLVLTDPAGQPVYAKQAHELIEATRLSAAASDLDGIIGRRASGFDPVGKEAAEVIVRRLFEHIERGAAETASSEYYRAYERVKAELPEALPGGAAVDYAKVISRTYPFHPRLLETAQDRLAALQDFHKSRGTLRLFARIVRDVWEQERDLFLISAGDLDWGSSRIQADLLDRLHRDSFKPSVNADVLRHARQLDEVQGSDVHRRVATALLLESLPLNERATMSKADLTLAVLRPNETGSEPGEAVDRLLQHCWHIYHDEGRTRFQFRYEPNINKIIEERSGTVSSEDARQAVRTMAHNYFRGTVFTLVAYPNGPSAVADSAQLKLVLTESEALAQEICDYTEEADAGNRFPRRFRNAILGIAATPAQFEVAAQATRRLTVAQEIQRQEQERCTGRTRTTPLLDEVKALLPDLQLTARRQTLRAFNRVVFQGRPSVTLTEEYLVSNVGPLRDVDGQTKLKDMLDDKHLIYEAGDALDVDLLLDELVKGATPSLEHDGAVLASAVHERALASPRLRLMRDEEPVRKAIRKAIEEGRLLLRLPDGSVYARQGCYTGPPEQRSLQAGVQCPAFSLSSDVLLAPSSAPCASAWQQVAAAPSGELLTIHQAATDKFTSEQKVRDAIDAGQLNGQEVDGQLMVVVDDKYRAWHPSGEAKTVSTKEWDEAVKYAARRPLLRLTLSTNSLDRAGDLIDIAQPFGARALWLSVNVSGELSGGGQLFFAVNDVKHSSPLKPIERAREMQRACNAATVQFSASLALDLAAPARPLGEEPVRNAKVKAAGTVSVEAEFGEEETSGAS